MWMAKKLARGAGDGSGARSGYVTANQGMLAARVAILFVLGAVLISGILGDILINVIFASRDMLGLD